jgi:glycosyltransferase involved in cell wall biosynthesis
MMPEMFTLLRKIVEREKFDIVHVDHSHMGKYGLWLKREFGLPVVLREHNFEALIYERFARTEPNLLKRLVANIHGRRLKREEVLFLETFDAIAAITNEDATLMRQAAPHAKVRVIPAGVDTEYFKPSEREENPDSILWIGSLAWDPNYDAVRFFLTSIFPPILKTRPEATFDIVGSESQRVMKLAARFGDKVRLLGQVPDIRDYLARSAVLVVPLRIGGGMRLKLLDFFSSGKAVVATSIAAEGNLAHDAIEVLIRDEPHSFATAIFELMTNRELRHRLGDSARKLVMQEYDWKKIGEDFTTLYGSVLTMRSGRPLATTLNEAK